MAEILYKELSYVVVGAAMEVHRTLGSAFLEGVFEEALVDDKIIPSTSSGHRLELKAVKAINEIHEAQAHNYLAASGLRLAIILNFGAPSLEFKRIVK